MYLLLDKLEPFIEYSLKNATGTYNIFPEERKDGEKIDLKTMFGSLFYSKTMIKLHKDD